MCAEGLHEQIERERKTAFPDPEEVLLYRRYAQGDQDKVANADMLRQAAGLTKHPFADNACGKVLALIASRVELTGFTVEDDAVQEFLDTLFTKAQLADQQYDIHFATVRDGNHAAILGWAANPDEFDNAAPGSGGRVTIHRERWWDGTSGVFVAYGDDSAPTYAVKDYHVVMGDPPIQRLLRTVYFPDHMEKYIRDGQGWIPYSPDPDGEPRPAWTKRDGTPLGLPVVHFANGSADDGPYGGSILGGGVIGLQDHLNDLHMDITVAARLIGFPMVTVTGYSPETDASGKAVPFRTGPGAVLKSADPATKFDVIGPGSLQELLNAYQMKLKAIASNTHTPEHVITGGDWPSGLALIRAEMPLIDLANRLDKTLSPSWQQVAHRSTEIANAYGVQGLSEDALITAEFAPPERLDETARAEADKQRLEVWQMAAAIEDETILKLTGLFSAEDIAALQKERAARKTQAMEMLVGVGAPEAAPAPAAPAAKANGRTP